MPHLFRPHADTIARSISIAIVVVPFIAIRIGYWLQYRRRHRAVCDDCLCAGDERDLGLSGFDDLKPLRLKLFVYT
jgi:hypothetical protein